MVVAFYSLHCAQTPEEFPLGLGESRLLRQRRLRPLPGLTLITPASSSHSSRGKQDGEGGPDARFAGNSHRAVVNQNDVKLGIGLSGPGATASSSALPRNGFASTATPPFLLSGIWPTASTGTA
jgi:hypothetical protein